MKPGWAIKSESDTDRVWAYTNRLGREVDHRYEFFDAEETPDLKRPVRRWPWAVGAGAIGVAASQLSRLL